MDEAFPTKTEEKEAKVLKDFQKESFLVKNCHFLCKMPLKLQIGVEKVRLWGSVRTVF